MYIVYIQKEAKKALKNIPQPDKNRITEKIVQLGKNPDNSLLDIKKLTGKSCFRMRVGSWRIIFNKNNTIKVISVERIKPRGGAYK